MHERKRSPQAPKQQDKTNYSEEAPVNRSVTVIRRNQRAINRLRGEIMTKHSTDYSYDQALNALLEFAVASIKGPHNGNYHINDSLKSALENQLPLSQRRAFPVEWVNSLFDTDISVPIMEVDPQ